MTPHFERKDLEREQRLVDAGEPIRHVHFLEGGVASITALTPEHGRTEVGIFGREGFSATAVLLGADRSPHETFMQVDGGDGYGQPEAEYRRLIGPFGKGGRGRASPAGAGSAQG